MLKRRTVDKSNKHMIAINTWLFAVGLVMVCYSWYSDYLVFRASGAAGVIPVNFQSTTTLATIAILFGGFFYSMVIIRPDRAKRVRERELLKLKMLSTRHEDYTDLSTGLYNHVAFDNSLDSYLTEFNRIEETLGLVLVNIDNMHGEYTDIMKVVATQLEKTARDYDIIGRIGPNRFAVITPHIRAENLFAIADRYRSVIEKSGSVPADLRMSIGFAATGPELRTADELFRAANQSVEVMRRLSRSFDQVPVSSMGSPKVAMAI